jgi:methionyl aminopeptidase
MITIKNPQEIETMRQGGKILASVVKKLAKKVKPGVSTQELDDLAGKLISQASAVPSFKNYRGYPKVACISVNEEVVHNIPSDEKILQKGDIVGLDLGLKYKGLYTDMAMTIPVARISKPAKKLIKVTRKALEVGLKKVKAGHTIGDIGHVIEKFVLKQGFSVVRTLTGHGVGKEVHEDPKIPNFGEKGKGLKLQEGMTLAIEPMVNIGSHKVMTKDDGWGIVTEDNSLSAHFEHTILVTKKGYEILTQQ